METMYRPRQNNTTVENRDGENIIKQASFLFHLKQQLTIYLGKMVRENIDDDPQYINNMFLHPYYIEFYVIKINNTPIHLFAKNK